MIITPPPLPLFPYSTKTQDNTIFILALHSTHKRGKNNTTPLTTTTSLPVPISHHSSVYDAHLNEDDNDDHHIVRQPQQAQEGLRDYINGANHVQNSHYHRQNYTQFKRHQDPTPSEKFCPNVTEDGGKILQLTIPLTD